MSAGKRTYYIIFNDDNVDAVHENGNKWASNNRPGLLKPPKKG